MKLKTIASLFKKHKHLTIYTAGDGVQWVSNGSALYSMRGLPHMTPEAILRIFDIPTDKHKEWRCEEMDMPLDCRDHIPAEWEIEPLRLTVEWDGKSYRFFKDERRIYTINEEYIAPLHDEPSYLTYHKRETTGGGFLLACKAGLELRAIIIPTLLNDTGLYIDNIKTIVWAYANMEYEKIKFRSLYASVRPDEDNDDVPSEDNEPEGSDQLNLDTLADEGSGQQ